MTSIATSQGNSSLLKLLFLQIMYSSLEERARKTNPTSDGPVSVEEVDSDAVFYKIELLGYQVGQRLCEKLIFTAANQMPMRPEQIDVLKFLCKEFWTSIFGKSIDNLKTNHRGTYVLQDSNFSWITRFTLDASSPATAKTAVLVLICIFMF